ncbi:unnamed protein product [Chrysoparadoxa australica]
MTSLQDAAAPLPSLAPVRPQLPEPISSALMTSLEDAATPPPSLPPVRPQLPEPISSATSSSPEVVSAAGELIASSSILEIPGPWTSIVKEGSMGEEGPAVSDAEADARVVLKNVTMSEQPEERRKGADPDKLSGAAPPVESIPSLSRISKPPRVTGILKASKLELQLQGGGHLLNMHPKRTAKTVRFMVPEETPAGNHGIKCTEKAEGEAPAPSKNGQLVAAAPCADFQVVTVSARAAVEASMPQEAGSGSLPPDSIVVATGRDGVMSEELPQRDDSGGAKKVEVAAHNGGSGCEFTGTGGESKSERKKQGRFVPPGAAAVEEVDQQVARAALASPVQSCGNSAAELAAVKAQLKRVLDENKALKQAAKRQKQRQVEMQDRKQIIEQGEKELVNSLGTATVNYATLCARYVDLLKKAQEKQVAISGDDLTKKWAGDKTSIENVLCDEYAEHKELLVLVTAARNQLRAEAEERARAQAEASKRQFDEQFAEARAYLKEELRAEIESELEKERVLVAPRNWSMEL